MRKSAMDKMFFMDKVDADVFVDIGCADGAVLKMIATLFPEHTYVGYDLDPKQIELARKDCPNNMLFVDSLDSLKQMVDNYKKSRKKICLTLSSLIHEVYAYKRQVNEFWDTLWGFKADFIAIRDMMVTRATSRQSDSLVVARVRQLFNPELLAEWEMHWGSIDENWSLIHFFLHYRYTSNWKREVRENYLPLTKEELLQLIPKEYVATFMEHFTLPFLRNKVWEDFRVQLQERTHLKLILERRV